MNDPYSVLGVDRTATSEDIEHAYRRLAMRMHPDHADAGDPAAVAEATRAFVELGEAHRILSDPRLRLEWGRQHAAAGRSTSARLPRYEPPAVRDTIAGMPVHQGWRLRFGIHARTSVGQTTAGIWLQVAVGEHVPDGVLGDADLYEVGLRGARLRYGDIKAMAANPAIRRIDLSETGVSDAEVAALCALPRLEQLRLDETAITDDVCGHLAKAPKLQELSIQETAIGDDGIAALGDCRRLHALDLRGTQVTADGLHALDRLHLWRLSLPPHVHWGDRRRLRVLHHDITLT